MAKGKRKTEWLDSPLEPGIYWFYGVWTDQAKLLPKFRVVQVYEDTNGRLKGRSLDTFGAFRLSELQGKWTIAKAPKPPANLVRGPLFAEVETEGGQHE